MNRWLVVVGLLACGPAPAPLSEEVLGASESCSGPDASTDAQADAGQSSTSNADVADAGPFADDGELDPGGATPTRSRLLKDTTTSIAVALSDATVFCSELGYGLSFLKVSVPDLDWLAHLNHRVEATGLPCAAAGACSDTLNPETILQGAPGLAPASVRVRLFEYLYVDAATGTCSRVLFERVDAVVRGVPLRHFATSAPEPLMQPMCAALLAL